MENVSGSILCRDGFGRIDQSNITGLNVTGEFELPEDEPSEETEDQADGIGIMLPEAVFSILILLLLLTLVLRNFRSNWINDESGSPWIVAESDALLVELDSLSISGDESDVSTDGVPVENED